MGEMAFDFLDLGSDRSVHKPRKTGLTMVLDVGMGLESLRDQLRVVGPYMDFAKIAVGTARLYDRALLGEKLRIYKEAHVRPFLGGQFLEYVVAKHGLGMVPRFMAESRELGISAVEVSDNCVDFTDDLRLDLVKMGRDAGLVVHGEVGSKRDKAGSGELIRQAELLLAAGCDLILFEAAELVDDGQPIGEIISAIHGNVPAENAMIELPGPWIKGVSLNDVYEMMKLVLITFGPDANIGNVAMTEVLELEGSRCGIGTSGPDLL